MKHTKKSKAYTLRGFTGLLLILNTMVLPQLNAATITPATDTPSAQIAEIQTEIKATAPAPVKPAAPAKAITPKSVIYVTVTAYSSTPDQTDDTPFITANGTYVHDGIIAANFLKFHTRVRFPDYFGDKIFTVEDRMNERYPDRADIWMETRDAAMDFGIHTLKMEILPTTLAEK